MISCINNQKQMGLATGTYFGDYNEYFPPTSLRRWEYTWDARLAPYMGVKGNGSSVEWYKFKIPGDSASGWICTPSFKCPLDNSTQKHIRSYAASSMYFVAGDRRGVIHDDISRKIGSITKPSQTIFLFDFWNSSNIQFQHAFSKIDGWLGIAGVPLREDGKFYHGVTMGFLFCDGSARELNPIKAYSGPDVLWHYNQ